MTTSTPSLSVVVPANDEEAVIACCLSFLPQLAGEGCRVVVVANGCTDDTAGVAREVAASHPDVTVLEVGTLGKPGALNAGDDTVGDVFPRVYLDADVVVSAATLRRLRDVLIAEQEPRVAAPTPRFALDGRPWSVRAFYNVFQRLPYAQDDLVGLGVYALNAAAHARLGRFPDVTADDLYVQRLFSAEERLVVADEFIVETPRTLAALVKVRTRVAAGNAELVHRHEGDVAFASSTGGTVRALARAARSDPRLLPAIACYVGVGLLARSRGGRSTGWERDSTTRRSPVPARVRLDTLDFDPVTAQDVVDRVLQGLDTGTGGVIVTPNIDIMQQCRDPSVRAVFQRADVVVADGAPVVLASRVAGVPLPERVPGSDLVPLLAGAMHQAGRSVMLVGGEPGVADQAAEVLRSRHPGLVVTTYCPPFGFEHDDEQTATLESAVLDTAPDLVCLGLGAPKQERLAHRLASSAPEVWFIGCGGAITMVAGHVPRAPRWVQGLGVEWLHRLVMEPRRLARRYLVDDLPYAVTLFVWALRERRRRRLAGLA